MSYTKIKTDNIASIARVEKWPDDARDYIAERTLSEEALRAAAVNFVGKEKAQERTGYTVRGLIWPFPNFKTGSPTDYCLLKPVPVTNKKFLAPKGESRIYFAPTFALQDTSWPEIAADTKIPIYIPEGPVKALRLAQEGRAVLCGNGVNGLGGLKKGFKKELKLIKWKGRRAIFVPDSDWETNFQVRLATITNADHLRALGADARIVLLPTLPGHDKTGADDYLSDDENGGIARLDGLTAHPSTDDLFGAWRVHPAIMELNRNHAVVTMSSDVRIVIEPDDRDTVPRFISRSAFQLMYAHRHMVVGQNRNGDIVKTVADVWLASEHRRQYTSVGFDPSGRAPATMYNYWRGWAYEPKAGDWSLFKKHILDVIVGGDAAYCAWLLNWMAHRVQYPGERNEVVIVLQSDEEGIGKTYFAEKIGALFGSHFIVVDKSEDIIGRFTARLQYGMLIFADEAFFAGNPQAGDNLKSMVTAKSLKIERKGQEAFSVANILGFIMASNHDHVIRAGLNARRYAVFDVNPMHQEDHAYFAAITKQMENGGYQAMLYDLQKMTVDWSAARTAPRTKALAMQKLFSLSHAERFILQCLCDDGRIPNWQPAKKKGQGMQVQTWSDTEDIQIVRSELQEAFRVFLEQQHAKEHEYRAMQTILGSALRRIFGQIKSVQYFDQNGVHRRRDVLPSLPKARTLFATATQNSWNWRTGEPKGK